jgi:hypothetical protein
MVDTAEVIAGVIANEIESTGRFSDAWERGFQSANRRTVQAQIYSLLKTRTSMSRMPPELCNSIPGTRKMSDAISKLIGMWP